VRPDVEQTCEAESICPVRRWPGAGSNRRPSDFQGAASPFRVDQWPTFALVDAIPATRRTLVNDHELSPELSPRRAAVTGGMVDVERCDSLGSATREPFPLSAPRSWLYGAHRNHSQARQPYRWCSCRRRREKSALPLQKPAHRTRSGRKIQACACYSRCWAARRRGRPGKGTSRVTSYPFRVSPRTTGQQPPRSETM